MGFVGLVFHVRILSLSVAVPTMGGYFYLWEVSSISHSYRMLGWPAQFKLRHIHSSQGFDNVFALVLCLLLCELLPALHDLRACGCFRAVCVSFHALGTGLRYANYILWARVILVFGSAVFCL